MDLYAHLYQDVLSPLYERGLRRRPTLDHAAWLDRTQWLPPDEIAALQLEKLRLLLAHAGAHVPYYRDLFARLGFDGRDVRSAADLAALPLLTRETIRERRADLTDPRARGRNIGKGTSGSTGVPLRFEYSRASEHWRQAIRLRGYGWAGYRPGVPAAFYWASGWPAPRGLAAWKVRLDRRSRRELYLDCLAHDDASHRAAAAAIARVRPHVLVCYTQAAAQLARWILQHGARDWADLPVLCGAEAVLPADRAALERAFGEVFETYGSRETMLIAAECHAHQGLHLSAENLLVEVVRDGAPCAPGESGDLAITDLHNYGMPFIRYQNGDLGTLAAPGVCPCGRGLPRLARVDGRRADYLRDRAGVAVPGLVVHVLLGGASELLDQFQVVQSATGDVTFKVVRGQRFRDDLFTSLVGELRQRLRGLPIAVEFHQRIPPSPSGKHRTIVAEPV